MKKYLYYALITFVFISCQKEKVVSDLSGSEKLATIAADSLALRLTNDSIIALDSTKFPKRPGQKRVASTDVFSSLYQLNGIDFFIQTKDSYFGKNTFQAQGKGQEVILAPYSLSNSSQLFRLRFLPSSSGIPYLIYSSQQNAPIGAGSYASNPNNYVLYTQAANNNSLFGFSWDFSLNTDQNAYYFENQDILGQGSGGPWDVYNYVLNVSNGIIGFTRKNTSYYQQLNIIPNDEFVVQDNIQISLDDAQITESNPVVLRQGEVINNTGNTLQRTLSFAETKTDASSFSETNGITTRKTGNASVKVTLFKVLDLGGGYTWENGTQETTQYGTNTSRSVTITESFNIPVPPNTISTYKFKAIHHKIKLSYVATMIGVNTSKVLNIGGVYTGVDYTTSSLEVSERPVGSSAARAATRTYTLYPKK